MSCLVTASRVWLLLSKASGAFLKDEILTRTSKLTSTAHNTTKAYIGGCAAQERPRGDTLHPRSGAAAKRRQPKPKVRSSGQEEIPQVQGPEEQLR